MYTLYTISYIRPKYTLSTWCTGTCEEGTGTGGGGETSIGGDFPPWSRGRRGEGTGGGVAGTGEEGGGEEEEGGWGLRVGYLQRGF